MFKKKPGKTPDAPPAKGLPGLPNDPKTPPESMIITKDTVFNSAEPPPEIKSVGVSLQPPAVKPQQAELNHPQIIVSDGHSNGLAHHQDVNHLNNEDNEFGEFQTHDGFDNSNATVAPPSGISSPKSPKAAVRTRSKTQTNETATSIKGKKPLNSQLSAIVEAPSGDERTRPNTAAPAIINQKHEPGITEESIEELGSNNSVKNKSPPPVKKAAALAKKKIESPETVRKSGETITVKKSKLKAVEGGNNIKPAISKPAPATAAPMTKPAIKKPKPKVVVVDDPSVVESQEFSAEGSGSLVDVSETDSQEFMSKESSEELESKSFEEEEESFAPKSKVEPEARERTASKKRVESAKLTKTKKAPTPKSASGTRSSNSRGSRSEKFQRRLQMKLDNDGFSAMGLSEADELPSSHTSKSDTHKRSSNQPAPPPHYLTATAAIPTTKKSTPPGNPGKAVLSRNPSSRRKAIKTLAYGAMGVADDEEGIDNRHHASRFGHYDIDDRRSKSMDPGEYRNRTSRQRMASDFANGHGVSDENDENIQELERRAVYNGNRANQPNDESNSNSSQEYRYSDRISGKYNSGEPAKNFGESAAGNLQKMPDRLMLSSSALKAAQDQGMVSPETVQYLKWYMVKAKPLEQAPTGSLTDTRFQGGSQARMGNSEPNLKQQLGGRDDDQPRGRVLFSKKAQPMGQRESIMDDEPKRKTFGSKNLVPPLRSSGSIMDDRPPEESPPAKPPVRKTRVTVVSKPKKLAPKKAEAKPLEGGKNTMAPSLAGPNGGIGYWPQGGPSSFMGGFPQFGFNGQPSYIQQQQYPPPFMQHPQLPTYNSTITSQAPLPSLQALQLTAPQFTPPPPTVHPGLVPARIKLTTVPVVTFKQSYVIEPTGHSPGTYIPPEEMGMDSNGGILTYISSGSFPSQSMDMSGGGGFMGYPGGNNPGYDNGFESQRQIATATTLRSMGEIRGAKPGPKSRAAGGGVAESGVRSMIKKGVIGRSTTTARGNYR